MPAFSLASTPQPITRLLHHEHDAPLPNSKKVATASADNLSPATLSARNHLTSELLRTLSRMALTDASSWPWIDHTASGLEHATDALIGLAFATTTPHRLTSPHTTNSQAHFSIGTPSPHKAPTACMRPVSGTISLPSRGTFHHSLTVLIHYRSPRSI